MILDNKILKFPLVSLIVTCHNLGCFLPDCIKSINAQSYKNFEIIVVDDFSNLENKNIIKKLKRQANLKILTLDKNLGQLGAFFEGFKKAKGEFICMVDADDLLLEDYLENHLKAHMGTNVAFTSCAQIEIDENSTVLSLKSISNPNFKNDDFKFNSDINILENGKEINVKVLNLKKLPFAKWGWNPSTSAMMRKSALEPLLLYKNVENFKLGADKFIFSMLHLFGGSATISKPLFAYRRHNSNNSNTSVLSGNGEFVKGPCMENLIQWNKKTRLEGFNFVVQNRDYLRKKLNPIGYNKLVFAIIFSLNFTTFKNALKALFYKVLSFKN